MSAHNAREWAMQLLRVFKSRRRESSAENSLWLLWVALPPQFTSARYNSELPPKAASIDTMPIHALFRLWPETLINSYTETHIHYVLECKRSVPCVFFMVNTFRLLFGCFYSMRTYLSIKLIFVFVFTNYYENKV